MRLWTIHPTFLDNAGLNGLWREGLLAQKVLQGQTRGYKNHSQLERFKAHPNPLGILGAYLWQAGYEGSSRGFNYNLMRIVDPPMLGTILMPNSHSGDARIPVTQGQVRFEFDHLFSKLEHRNPKHLYDLLNYFVQASIKENKDFRLMAISSAFRVVSGDIESWEKGKRLDPKYSNVFELILSSPKSKLRKYLNQLRNWGKTQGGFKSRFSWQEVLNDLLG